MSANPEGVRLHVRAGPTPADERLVLERGGRFFALSPELGGDPLRLDQDALTRDRLLADVDARRFPETEAPAADEGVGLPLPRRSVGKILALGKNFRAHAEEFGEQVPEEPLFFNKLPETLVPHGATVAVPSWYTGRVDHEAELAVVIGRTGRAIERAHALEHVAGYTVANDLTARSLQGHDRKLGYPWFRSKNLDGFCPLGPVFVPRDFLAIEDLRVTAHVDGELRQDASTRDWIVDVPHALEFLSRHLTLHRGDLVLTGTPAGVGPLVHGSRVVCGVEGIGALATVIARP